MSFLDGVLAIGLLLLGLFLRLSLRRETDLRTALNMEAQTINDLQNELWRINADVMCRNYGCGCLKLTDACLVRDKELRAKIKPAKEGE